MGALNTLDFILNHPLNRKQRCKAITRFVRWQIGSRLLPGPVVVDFVGESRLLAQPGMTGATGNVYAGLHEFWEMAFTLHLLQKGDLFVDVGANVGSYTVLASAAVGAACVSAEPVPATYQWLQSNIKLNDAEPLATALNVAIGGEKGNLKMTSTEGATNHIVSNSSSQTEDIISISVETLDRVLDSKRPVLIKVDVEGFEDEVVRGGADTLAKESLLGVIMEINGSEQRYGVNAADLRGKMMDFGFEPYVYDPMSRELDAVAAGSADGGNVLFLRNVEKVKSRVVASSRYETSTGVSI
jgi:FkbM family methyltransferase